MDMTFKVESSLEKADEDPEYRRKLVKYLNKLEGDVFNVVDCIKVGKVVLHILDRELPSDVEALKGLSVKGSVDKDRRAQLQAHHSGTHIVFASCRKVLGPHIW